MKEIWMSACTTAAYSRVSGTFWCGCRKISRGVKLHFGGMRWADDLGMSDLGYTASKMKQLDRNYLHEESVEVALMLWKRRLNQKKYGSVGITTYNHFLKNDPNKKSKRASVMGPCIQAVTITLMKDGTPEVDVFYRTTELFKKFPADLVWLRDRLLKPFELEDPNVTFHFANMTTHPMYIATILPHLSRPIQFFETMKLMDPHMWKWSVKWTARYLCEEHARGILKFSQALRVQKGLVDALDRKVNIKIANYLRNNHPGFRNDHTAG